MKKYYLTLLGGLFAWAHAAAVAAEFGGMVPPAASNAEASAVLQKQQDNYVRQSSQYNFNQQNDQQNGISGEIFRRTRDGRGQRFFAISSLETMQGANKSANEAIAACETRRKSGVLKNHVEAAKCSNTRIQAAFDLAEYPYSDIIRKFTEKRLSLARKLDKTRITVEEAGAETEKFTHSIAAEEQARGISTLDY